MSAVPATEACNTAVLYVFDRTAVLMRSHLYCCDPLEVNGVKPTMKKCRRGKGIKFTASFLRSEFSWPGNLRQHVMPDMTAEIRWFKSPKVGVVSFKVRKQMSYKASLSKIMHSSAFSTSWCTESVAL